VRKNIMKNQYYPPEFKKTQFTCPYCGVLANQVWRDIVASGRTNEFDKIWVSLCTNEDCHKECLWIDKKMSIPDMEGISYRNEDLNSNIQDDYIEARSILTRSPRGASALLRLCLQKLCRQLGEPGKNINDDIASLVKKGLRPSIQKSLDILRVTGNNAVHPGVINMKDNREIALKLFELINLIAEVTISEPKRIDDLYETTIPKEAKDAIEERDTQDDNTDSTD